MMLWVALLALAQDEVYLSEEEALVLLFGKEAAVVRGRFTLTADQKKAVEKKLGHEVDAAQFAYVATSAEGKTIGFAMVWEEIGKYKPITFMVGTDPEGKIKAVHILVYREPIGGDVRKPWWRKQFEGKSAKDPIKRDRDIDKITGATLSCDGICLGVRKVVALIDAGLVQTPDNARKILQADPREKPVKRQQHVMGTLCTIEAYGADRAKVEKAVQDAFDEIQRLDDLLSNYKEDSELSKMNSAREFEASDALLAFVKDSLRYAEASRGAFDPTVEPAVRMWGFFDHKFRVPTLHQIADVRELVGHAKVKIDGKRILFEKKGMGIDPGGLGKGYAVDRAVKILRDAGITSAFIDFGRSSQAAIGAPPGEEGWIVGIRSPQDPSTVALRIRIRDLAVSTSSQSDHWFEEEGKIYGHILDPATCMPVDRQGSVTIVHAQAGMADAFSTAAFVMGSAKALEWAKTQGIEAGFVSVDKTLKIECSEGFRKLVISDK